MKHKIATIGSHSALQILKGAQQEGFETICIAIKGREKPYKSFDVADEYILIDSYKDFSKIENDLIKKNAIIIPHASFLAYMGTEKVEKMKVPYFGNKKILEWEYDRAKERKWLTDAGLNLPKIFDKPEDIDRAVIVKFHGADGGKGYFVAKNTQDFNEKMKDYKGEKDYVIQEYIMGVHCYIHYLFTINRRN